MDPHPSEAMENKQIEDFSQDFEDTLSLRNLPIDGYDHGLDSRRPSICSDQDLFEFFTPNDSVSEIMGQDEGDEQVNEYRKRDYLCLRTESFNKDRGYQWEFGSESEKRYGSDRFRAGSPAQKVNITALTSMSSTSRRRMFMFGPVKFKPEMDVNAIRERRNRRAPPRIQPMREESQVVSSGGRGLARPLWCRSHLATALAKSFGCISTSIV